MQFPSSRGESGHYSGRVVYTRLFGIRIGQVDTSNPLPRILWSRTFCCLDAYRATTTMTTTTTTTRMTTTTTTTAKKRATDANTMALATGKKTPAENNALPIHASRKCPLMIIIACGRNVKKMSTIVWSRDRHAKRLPIIKIICTNTTLPFNMKDNFHTQTTPRTPKSCFRGWPDTCVGKWSKAVRFSPLLIVGEKMWLQAPLDTRTWC